jgi:hypothetical protein
MEGSMRHLTMHAINFRTFKMKRALLLFLLPMASAHGASIYLCKGYDGGTFWAQAHCNQHRAHIDRIVSVPEGLPWDQQVNIGEQQLREIRAQQHRDQAAALTVISSQPVSNGECMALDQRLTQLREMARQPQSGQSHDWIRSEEKVARDRQFAIRCR